MLDSQTGIRPFHAFDRGMQKPLRLLGTAFQTLAGKFQIFPSMSNSFYFPLSKLFYSCKILSFRIITHDCIKFFIGDVCDIDPLPDPCPEHLLCDFIRSSIPIDKQRTPLEYRAAEQVKPSIEIFFCDFTWPVSKSCPHQTFRNP